MNKTQLLNEILKALEVRHQNAIDAAMQAYTTATDQENVAENKYDTLGLEAAYLAHGQAQRVIQCKDDVVAFEKCLTLHSIQKSHIDIGDLVCLVDERNEEKFVFLGPVAGGLKLIFNDKNILLITPAAPLGQALLGRVVGDEIEMNIGRQSVCYEILKVY